MTGTESLLYSLRRGVALALYVLMLPLAWAVSKIDPEVY